MATTLEYLKYVKNTNGHATLQHFIEDWEPIGNMLWNELSKSQLICLIDGKVYLTSAGEDLLK